MKKHEVVCVFGDSTSWGAWDLEKGGWVNRLWLSLADHEPYVQVYNLGIDGGTSKTILDRFPTEAATRHADALIFQTGGNDASYEGKNGACRVSIEEFKANIEAIVLQAKKITPNIVFMDLKNCDESKTMPVSWMDVYYTNANLMKYNDAMKEVCDRHGVLHVQMPHLENDEFEDGIHPNARGHEKIFSVVKEFLTVKDWI